MNFILRKSNLFLRKRHIRKLKMIKTKKKEFVDGRV